MSPTPRTDALCQNGKHITMVPADFARKLERELVETNARLQALMAFNEVQRAHTRYGYAGSSVTDHSSGAPSAVASAP